MNNKVVSMYERTQQEIAEVEKHLEGLKAAGELEILTKEESMINWPKEKPKGAPDKDGNQKYAPYSCVENTEALLEHYGYAVRYNEMSKDVEINCANDEKTFHSDTQMNAKLTWLIDKAHHHSYPASEIDSHVGLIAGKNAFHPVRDWISSEPWDGKSRLKQFYGTVETDHPMKENLMRKWGIMCVAAVFDPVGIAPQGVLTFANDQQGIGKTRWLKSIVGDPKWVAEGQALDPHDKDSVLTAVGHWIIELGEIGATFRKADIQALKAFITKDADILRPPYERKANKYGRRTCFFGTVDDPRFLVDKAGNRRWWVMNVTKIDNEHGIELQQLWAEIYNLYANGERFWMDADEINQVDEANEENMSLDPIEQRLDSNFKKTAEEGFREAYSGNCTDILLNIGVHNPSKADLNNAGKILKKAGFKYSPKGRKYHGYIKTIIDG